MHATLSRDRTRPWPLSSPWTVAAAFLAALTAVRVAMLWLSGLGLHGDEAQYWTWSEDLAFGYYSKPPVVAWLIRAATELCGDGAACVRLPSPLLHLATALMVGAVARRLYDDRTALWAAIAYATLPAVTFSSAIMSTDVPLLFFWAVALYAFIRLLDARSLGWAAVLGVAIGLGAMSKYAMVYFPVCGLLYCAANRDARWVLASRHALLAGVIAALVLAPNLMWNAAAGWATLGHTADNAHWTGFALHWGNMLEFFGAQFGVFGPILFAAFLLRFITDRHSWRAPDRLLAYFSLPIVALMVVQALLSRAHANWAATAYVAAAPLVVAWLLARGRAWLTGSVALHLAAAALLYAAVFAPATVASAVGKDPFARLRGWPVLAAEVERRMQAEHASVLLLDHRMTFASLAHALRDAPVRLAMWDYDGVPGNHYEQFARFDAPPGAAGIILLIRDGNVDAITRHFDAVTPLGTVARPDAAGGRTVYRLYRLDSYRPGAGR